MKAPKATKIPKPLSKAAYAKRVEKLRKRSAAGEAFTIEYMAKYLRLTAAEVTVIAKRNLNKPGGFIPLINDTGGRPN